MTFSSPGGSVERCHKTNRHLSARGERACARLVGTCPDIACFSHQPTTSLLCTLLTIMTSLHLPRRRLLRLLRPMYCVWARAKATMKQRL